MGDIEEILNKVVKSQLTQEKIERNAAKIRNLELKQVARSLRGALKGLLKDPVIKSLQSFAVTNQTFYVASESWKRSVLGFDEYGSLELDERKRYIALTGKGFCVMEWGYDSEKNESRDRAIRFGRKLLFLSLYHAAKEGTTVESMKSKLYAQAEEVAKNEERYSLESLREQQSN